MSAESTTIRWEQDADGVVVLTLDDPNQSANTMNAAYAASIRATVDRLEAEKDAISGVIITSAKKTFFAGGDLNDLKLATRENADEIAGFVRDGKAVLRRLETLGTPVVAAINGAALGGGLEIALACHHRIVVDDPKAVVGFPEVQLGLLPGAGGVVRTVRMLGIVNALMQLLLQGQRLRPAKALEVGVVNEVVPTRDDLIPAAKKWIAAQAGEEVVQPWDVKGYKIPGGTPSTPSLAANLPAFPANLRKQIKGANYPAPHHIMAAAVEGAQVDFDNASDIEGRYFVDLVTGQVSKNMIQAFFFDLQRATGDRGRPAEIETFTPSKVVVLGAGMMGAAIAYVCAKAGLQVVLKDVDQAAADNGKALLREARGQGRRARPADPGGWRRAAGARSPPPPTRRPPPGRSWSSRPSSRTPRSRPRCSPRSSRTSRADALLGSNTSTLPITELAANVTRPADFIGLHFFSPVDKMPLLEIIRGEQTSDETLYRALDVAKLIKKTPIVVNDSRGFFTSRVIGTFINEGIAMLLEGVPAPTIEQASSQAGYPAPVLQLSDELNLKLMRKIRNAAEQAAQASSTGWDAHPSEQVIDRMLDEFQRPGRLEGAGFYEYEDGKRTRLWPGLRDAFPVTGDPSQISLEDLEERMLIIESLETVKCLDEGVIESVADANIGSIMGIGFPGWTGGVLQYINGYEGGLPGFIARARQLAERYGERFQPPASLVEKAERGEIYSDEEALITAR